MPAGFKPTWPSEWQEFGHIIPPILPQEQWVPSLKVLKSAEVFVIRNGELLAPEYPGIGLDVDEEAIERPLRFQLNDHEYFVEDVVDQWYGPNDALFKVRASDGNLYVLRRRSSTPGGEWSLESYRDLARDG